MFVDAYLRDKLTSSQGQTGYEYLGEVVIDRIKFAYYEYSSLDGQRSFFLLGATQNNLYRFDLDTNSALSEDSVWLEINRGIIDSIKFNF
jgi:hypothetical protein